MVRGLLIFIVLVALNTYAQEWDWVKRINGYQNDSSLGVDVDDSGYVYVTGRSKYAVTFEDGINSIFHPGFAEQDIFVAKYDSLGNLIWANVAGSYEFAYDQGYDVVADGTGGCYLAGMTNDSSYFGNDTIFSVGASEAFISKVDQNGNFVWTKKIGSSALDRSYGVEVDNDGNVYFCGYIASTAVVEDTTLGTLNKLNGFLAKMDSDGNLLGIQCFKTSFSSFVYSIDFREENTLYISGGFSGTTTFDGIPKTASSSTQTDAFLAKFDTDLSMQWFVSGGSTTMDVGYEVCSVNNSVYLAGVFTGNANFSGTTISYNAVATGTAAINNARDFFIAKYDTVGNLIWIKNYGNQGMDEIHGLDVTSEHENIYLSGYFMDTVNFDGTWLTSTDPTKADLIIMKMDSSGNIVWIKQNGNGLSTHSAEIAIDKNENIFHVGEYYQSHFFDDHYLITNGSRDGFMGKILQHPMPNFFVQDSIFCPGDTIVLEIDAITSPLSYEWNITSILDSWTTNNLLYLVMPDTLIALNGFVIVSNSSYDDTLFFTENPTFYPEMINANQLISDTLLCPGDEITLFTNDSLTNITWMSAISSDSIVIQDTGTYFMQGLDVNGCLVSDTTTISYYSVEQLTLGEDSITCESNFLITAPSIYQQYYWSNGEFGTNVYNINVFSSGLYFLDVIDNNGCSSSDSIEVTILNCLQVEAENKFDLNYGITEDGLLSVFGNSSFDVKEFLLTDYSGKAIFKSSFIKNQYDVSFLETGFYILIFVLEDGTTITGKIWKS